MDDEAISLANYIGGVVQGDAIEFMRRSRSGVSSSMNGALEYTGLKVAEKALAWFAPIRAELEARAAAAERERDELRAAQQWQPIETAPKDGTRIMVWRKAEDGFESRRLGVDLWRENCWWMSRKPMPPTHWQPLPAPPQPR